jgi:hypothetical protein
VAPALFGGGVTVFVMVFAGWKEMTEFRIHTQDRLDRIEPSERT